MSGIDGRRGVGAWGERHAREFLAKLGYRIIESNYRSRTGEVDIVAEEKGCLVFVEVKTRRSSNFGEPEEAITPRKEARLAALADEYIQARGLDPADWRVDLVTVRPQRGQNPEVRLIRNAARGLT